MEKEVDLRGLVCPEPVLRTKKLLDDKDFSQVVVLVESEVNVKNLERLANSKKIVISSSQQNDHYKVVLAKDGNSTFEEKSEIKNASGEVEVAEVVFLGKDKFGDGDEDFSKSLLNVYLQTMYDAGHRPRAILMANTGVKLMASDSNVKPVLDQFREAGCDVLACGLCVDFYGLKGKIDSDQITNMFAIVEYMMSADKVINP